jgi:hypothetical protein
MKYDFCLSAGAYVDGISLFDIHATWSILTCGRYFWLHIYGLLLRRIFGPKRDGVTGEWRKMHKEELHNLYSSPSIIKIIKSRRMRWAEHVARMGKKRNVYRLLVGKPEGKNH